MIENHLNSMQTELKIDYIDYKNYLKLKETTVQKINRDCAKTKGGKRECFVNLKDVLR